MKTVAKKPGIPIRHRLVKSLKRYRIRKRIEGLGYENYCLGAMASSQLSLSKQHFDDPKPVGIRNSEDHLREYFEHNSKL